MQTKSTATRTLQGSPFRILLCGSPFSDPPFRIPLFGSPFSDRPFGIPLFGSPFSDPPFRIPLRGRVNSNYNFELSERAGQGSERPGFAGGARRSARVGRPKLKRLLRFLCLFVFNYLFVFLFKQKVLSPRAACFNFIRRHARHAASRCRRLSIDLCILGLQFN